MKGRAGGRLDVPGEFFGLDRRGHIGGDAVGPASQGIGQHHQFAVVAHDRAVVRGQVVRGVLLRFPLVHAPAVDAQIGADHEDLGGVQGFGTAQTGHEGIQPGFPDARPIGQDGQIETVDEKKVAESGGKRVDGGHGQGQQDGIREPLVGMVEMLLDGHGVELDQDVGHKALFGKHRQYPGNGHDEIALGQFREPGPDRIESRTG